MLLVVVVFVYNCRFITNSYRPSIIEAVNMRTAVGLALVAAVVSSPVLIETVHKDAAPIYSASNAESIPNSYMVVFKDHVTDDAAQVHHSWVQDIHLNNQAYRTELKKRDQTSLGEEIFQGLRHTYTMTGFLGYAGHFDEDVIEQVRQHPDVAFIELDSQVYTMNNDTPVTQKNSPWGLARVSHRKGLSFSTFNKVRRALS